MTPLVIKCFRHTSEIVCEANQFFILSVGDNAGKPNHMAWRNSFIATAQNVHMREFYFWLVYGLHKSKAFNKYLRGSVIPFLSVQELRNTIMGAARYAYPHFQQFKEVMEYLERFEAKKTHMRDALQKIEAAQQALITGYLRSIGFKG